MKVNSFEKKLEIIKEKINALMDAELTLEESITIYKEGLKIIKEAQKELEEAKLKVQTITQEELGDLSERD